MHLCKKHEDIHAVGEFGTVVTATRWSIKADVEVLVCCHESSRVTEQASSGHTCEQQRFTYQAASECASGQAATCYAGCAKWHNLTKCLDHAKYQAYYLLSMLLQAVNSQGF